MKNFIEHYQKSLQEEIQYREDIFKDLKIMFPSAKVYRVGGAVRDTLMSQYHLDMKTLINKDIDYLVANVPMDALEKFLSQKGKVELVGQSFGVLKFWFSDQNKTEEPLDIAIPRLEREKEGEKGHRATDVMVSHEIPPEEDLKRRDFTINMIGQDISGKLLDPFQGEADIKNKVLRMVKSSDDPSDPYHHFFIDPLRMLRGIQFVARFNLKPDREIIKWFKIKSSELKHITAERILMELNKLFEKGKSIFSALQLAQKTDLISYMFPGASKIDMKMTKKLDQVFPRTTSFSLAVLLNQLDLNQFKSVLNNLKVANNDHDNALFFHWYINTAPSSKDIRKWMVPSISVGDNLFLRIRSNKTKFLAASIKMLESLKIDVRSLRENEPYIYLFDAPNSLAITGKDILAMGYKGPEIGSIQSKMTQYLLNHPRDNKSDILSKVISN